MGSAGSSGALPPATVGAASDLCRSSDVPRREPNGLAMDIALVAVLVLVAFVVLLLTGRAQIAKGANAQVANGAVLLTLAAIIGLLALDVLSSLDVW